MAWATEDHEKEIVNRQWQIVNCTARRTTSIVIPAQAGIHARYETQGEKK